MSRLFQVLQYGRKHAVQIAKENNFSGIKRCSIFVDILSCYRKYRMWSNQYMKERFWELSREERKKLGATYLEKGLERDAWQKRFQSDKHLYVKYGAPKYELGSRRRMKRNKAYQEHYGSGDGLTVENDVQICQQHYLNGSIKIGKNVLLAKHVFIDYSGDVVIKDNVAFSSGAILESHTHQSFSDPKCVAKTAIAKRIIINEDVKIGGNAYILDSCGEIGRLARIGAGAVVRNSIPPYAIVVGNPAKIVGFVFTPMQMREYENEVYQESERTSFEYYSKVYEKYYSNRLTKIAEFLKN